MRLTKQERRNMVRSAEVFARRAWPLYPAVVAMDAGRVASVVQSLTYKDLVQLAIRMGTELARRGDDCEFMESGYVRAYWANGGNIGFMLVAVAYPG